MKDIHPMGALSATKEKIEELYTDPNYIAERKYDGSRYILQISKAGMIYLTSRKESVNGGMVDKTQNVPYIIADAKQLPLDTILDGEVDIEEGRNFHHVQGIMGSLPGRAADIQTMDGPLYFKCFDILRLNGKDLRSEKLYDRKLELERLLTFRGKFQYIKLVEFVRGEKKRKLFDEEIENGAEGIMLKNLQSVYVEGKKPRNSWYKIKLVDTFDGIVTGYELGKGKYANMLGALKVSQYLGGKLTEVATVSGMTDAQRVEFKGLLDADKGFIIEFAAQEPEVHGRYRHPRFKRVRGDKNPLDCVYGEK